MKVIEIEPVPVVEKDYSHLLKEFEFYIHLYKLNLEEITNLVDFVSGLEEARFRWKDEYYKMAILYIVLKETRPYTIDIFYTAKLRSRLIYCIKELLKKLNINTRVWNKKDILKWFVENGYIDSKEAKLIQKHWKRKYNNEIKNFFYTINKLEKQKLLNKKNYDEFELIKMKTL